MLGETYELRAYAGGVSVEYASPLVNLTIVLDRRGELDAILEQVAAQGQRHYLRDFTDLPRNRVEPPPVMFSRSERTQPVTLLASLVQQYASDALAGHAAAFVRAAAKRTRDSRPD